MTGHNISFGLNPGTGSSLSCATLPTERQTHTVRPTASAGRTTSQVRLMGERVRQNSKIMPLITVAIKVLLAICQNGNMERSLSTDHFDLTEAGNTVRFRTKPYSASTPTVISGLSDGPAIELYADSCIGDTHLK